jgi:hypothetical protein
VQTIHSPGISTAIKSDAFSVTADAPNTVIIVGPTVTAAGMIKRNGRPIAGAMVEFAPRRHGLGPVASLTNQLGEYELSLPESGLFDFSVSVDGLPAASRAVRVTGDNRHINYDLPFGQLIISTLHARIGAGFTVAIQSPDASVDVKVDADAVSNTSSVTVVQQRGLPFGTYTVSAFQVEPVTTRELSSRLETLTLDRTHPTATVTLDLNGKMSHLTVLDTKGHRPPDVLVTPLRSASLFRFFPSHLSATLDGTYSLDGISSGTRLIVESSGYVPICRVVPDAGDIYVTLQPGVPVTLKIPGLTRSSLEVVSLSGLVGSDCPVPLYAFVHGTPLGTPLDLAAGLAVDHFPTTDKPPEVVHGWPARHGLPVEVLYR